MKTAIQANFRELYQQASCISTVKAFLTWSHC